MRIYNEYLKYYSVHIDIYHININNKKIDPVAARSILNNLLV